MKAGHGVLKQSKSAMEWIADNPRLTDFDFTIFLKLLSLLGPGNVVTPFTITGLATSMKRSREGVSRSLKRLTAENVIEPFGTSRDPVYRIDTDIAKWLATEAEYYEDEDVKRDLENAP